MIYGYSSIKSAKGSHRSQIERIKALASTAVVIKDHLLRGKNDELPVGMQTLLSRLKNGDTLIVCDVTKLACDAQSAMQIYENVLSREAGIQFLDAPFLNTDVLLHDYSSLLPNKTQKEALHNNAVLSAYIEYAFAHAQRTHDKRESGRIEAQLNGKTASGKKGLIVITSRYLETKNEIEKNSKAFDGTKTDQELITELGLARNTYFKYKKMIKAERLARQESGIV